MANIPKEDETLLDALDGIIRGMYAKHGGLNPFIAMQMPAGEGPTGVDLFDSGGLDGQQEKRLFVMAGLHRVIRYGSPRAALVYEAWVRKSVSGDTTGEEIERNPDDEAVYVLMRTDAGETVRIYGIDRTGGAISLRIDRTTHEDDPARMSKGDMVGFYVPMPDRNTPHIVQWCAMMDMQFGDPTKPDAGVN